MSRAITMRWRLIAANVALALASLDARAQQTISASALPTGGRLTGGQATISQSGAAMSIVQGTSRAALDWQSFNIGANASVVFIQPSANAVALNRVLGGSPSQIFGRLSSNGQVFLTNPSGILFGRGAQVDVGGILATTLAMSTDDFMSGNFLLRGNGTNSSILNEGTLRSAPKGYVALIAPVVQNTGVIDATSGTAALVAANAATVDFMADGLIQIKVGQGAINAEITNKGAIRADGGTVFLTASALDSLARSVVNNSGIIEARGVDNVKGVIRLSGGEVNLLPTSSISAEGGGQIEVQGGTVIADGRIDASNSSGIGGSINLLGDKVGLVGNARVDASGDAGGGTVLVGGDFHGMNPNVQNAQRTYVGSGVTINADASTQGDGGKVAVWADGDTHFYGTISARGGAQSGNGGFVETSAGRFLDVLGTVDTRAPLGTTGTWLLDPTDITIQAGIGAFTTLTQVDQFADSNSGANTIAASVINSAASNVTLQASGSITFGAPVSIATAGVGLTAQTQTGNITVNSGITTAASAAAGLTTGSVTLSSNSGNIVLNSNIVTGNATVANAAGTTAATTGGITLSAPGGSVTGSGLLTTGNASLTGTSAGVRNSTDTANSGSISVTAGGGGVNLGGANALTVGTSNVAASQGIATVGNMSIASGGAINSGGSPLQVKFGAATSGGNAATRVAGKLSASTSVVGAGIFVASPSTSLELSTITADGNVVLQGSTDITLSGTVSVTGAGARITAQAGRHINVNAALTTNNGQINLEADSPDAPGNTPDKIGQLTITAPVSSNGGAITLIAGGNAGTSNSITGPDGNVNNVADNSGFRPIAVVDAGAGGINLALSRSTDELGIGVTGSITQILGNGITTPGFGSISNLRTTGPMVIGRATTAGTDGLGTGAQTLTVNRISNTYNNSYIALTPIVAGTFELVAGGGGILLDQPLTTYQPTAITTTGTLTISDPINTSGFGLTLPANVTVGANGSINTGGGSCSGTGCPVTDIFWDGGAGTMSWFDLLNWSTNTLPGLGNNVTIDSGAGTILISSAGAQAKSLIANRSLTISGSGSLTLANASQVTGLFTLSGGTLAGAGSAAVTGASGSLVWSGGTMDTGGSFLLGGGNSGTLSNALTLNRLFENQGALTLSGASVSGTGSIVNSGLLTATSGTSNTINTSLLNIITPTIGTIQLSGAGTALTATNFPTNDGQIIVTNGGTFSTGANSLTNTATSSLVVDAGNYTTGGASVTTASGNLAVSGALSAGTIALLSGGGVTLNAVSSVTATGSTDDAIVISGASLTNNAGAGALVLNPLIANPNARWLVYLSDPAGNTFGPSGNLLSSGNTAIWGQSYPVAVADAGNRYVFANTGVVTVTTTGASKIYGDASIDLSANFALSGKPVDAATYGNVYLNSTAIDIFSAGPTVASIGNTAIANAGAYSITGTGTANTGYSLVLNNSGQLTVGARPITVTADAGQQKTYGNADPASFTYTTSSLGSGIAVAGALTRAAGETVAGGPYAITQGTVTNANNTNYAITYVGDSFAIGQRPITVTADAGQQKTYGNADPASFTYTTSSLGSGIAVAGALTRAAGETVAGGPYAITQGTVTNANNTNYAITYVGDSFAIGQRPITVTADAGQQKTYGNADPASFTYTTSSLGSGIAVAGALTRAAGETVAGGPYAITQGTVTNANNTNYAITYVGDSFAIGQRPITVTADAGQQKTYGNADPASFTYTTSSLGSGIAVAGALTRAAGETVAGGPYAITQGTVTNANNTNYAITYVGDSFAIGQRPITVTADAGQQKTYGNADPASFTYTTSSLGSGIAVAGALTRAAGETVAGGPYAITQGTVTNANNTNYAITYVGDSFAIGQRPITVTADAGQQKTYGNADPASFTYTTSSLGSGIAVAGALTRAAGETVAGGPYAITQGTVTNANNTNYAITYVGDSFAIGQRPITVTADAGQQKTYGNADPASFTYTTSSLGSGIAVAGALTRAAGETVAGGPYAITQGTVTNANNTNYAITYVGDSFAIGQRPITVTADAGQQKTYGNADPASFTYTTSSLGSGIAVAGALTRAAGETVAGGPYAITQGTVTNANNTNYAITYVGDSFAIGQRPITVTADAGQQKTYGNADPASFTYTTSSLGSGIAVAGALTRAAGETVAGGPYAITQGTVTNANNTNYAITYVGDSFAIGQRPITVTADAGQQKTYGNADPASFTYTTSSLGSGIAVAGALTRAAGETVAGGPYAITQGTVTNANNTNYAITYVGDSFAIGQRPITVTADAGQQKTYGNADPASFTYTTSSLGSGIAVAGALTRAAGETVAGGPYAITQGTVTNANNTNYAITYVGDSFAIGQRPITVTADAGQQKTYGNADPASFTYTTSSLGSGIAVAGALTRAAGETVAGGPYAITQGTVTNANNTNYAITYVGDSFAIGQRPITVTADAGQQKTYGNADPASFTYTTSSLGSGIAVAGALTRAAGETVAGGPYAITQGTVTNANNTNYAITYVGDSFAIGQRPITVTADAGQQKTYGNADPASFTYTTSSLGSGIAVAGALTRAAGETVAGGPYAITQGTVTNANNTNYAITYVGDSFAIGQRPITVTADAGQQKTYGNADPASFTYTTSSLGSGIAVAGALTRAAGETVAGGPYAITQGTVTNANNTNYAITYVGDSFAIGQRPITVTADAGQQKTYGNADPASFTYTTSSLGSGIAVAGALTRAAGETVAGGPYAITQGTVTNANNTNYAITYVGDSFAIGQRPITVAPSSVTLSAGATIPTTDSITFVSGSVGAGDQIAASVPVSTTATSTSPVGTYSLIPGGVQFLQGSESNYSITYQVGSLSITAAQPPPLTSAITNAVSTATATAASTISSGTSTAVVTISTSKTTSTDLPSTPTASTSASQRGTPGADAASAASAAVRAQLESNMLELHTRKLNAVGKAVKLLEQDPNIADLQLCSGPVSDDCIAVRPAGGGSGRGQQRVAEHSYSPGVERKVALLIGVGDYQGGIPKLSSPAKDVQEIGKIMQDKFGYEVRTVLNADKARIVHELNRLILESNDDDSIAIMYAGHGHLVEKTQRGYWIPSKASADDPKQWISNQDIARALGNIPAKQIFLVSDSCYSGTLTHEAKIDRTDISPDPQAVLGRRSVTALSSGGDEPVADEGKDGHSVFAWHLMEQLKAVKDVSLGVGVYEQIAESVKAEIPQTPQYGASPSSGHQRGGDYLFEIRPYRQ